MKRPMRRSSVTKVSRNARSISASEPGVSPGSGTPQCAVSGWPGHTGQTSRAALSQSVKMQSIRGAPGLANSSQLLLSKPAVGSFADTSCASAFGFTSPAGWLPALNAWNSGAPRTSPSSRAARQTDAAGRAVAGDGFRARLLRPGRANLLLALLGIPLLLLREFGLHVLFHRHPRHGHPHS